MQLEKEINQKQYRNEYHKLAVNIIFTHGWLMEKQAAFLKDGKVTAPQYNLLRILRGQYPKPASINLLKKRMLDKMSDASRLVERLLQKGLVDRQICPQDRRRVEVVITEKGLNLLKELDAFDNEADLIFKELSLDEVQLLNNLLDKMRR